MRKRDVDLLTTMTKIKRDTDLPLDQSIGTHTVFISHCGLKMKRSFANHLYHSLKNVGIKAFLDMEELPVGDDVRPFMLEAARRATIQVPIFTSIYAESMWCLEELVEMMNSKRSSNAKVIPVYFDVKSEDLRNKDGPFAKAIHAHRKERKRNDDTIHGWEDALNNASWLEGFRLENFDKREGELLKHLVEKIVHEIEHRTPPEVDRNAVGLEERVHNVVELFHLKEERNVFFLLLWGMSGIGKTTLAQAISDRLGKDFHATSFVENCGDEKPSRIRDSLLNELLHQNNFQGNLKKGRECLKNGLREKKVLIIFDDVKNYKSIEEVIDLTSLHPGSLILVTSTSQSVFPHETALSDVFKGERYEVQGMGDDDSLRLLCLHAFRKPYPEPGFEVLARSVNQACGGLPLSLEVVGRHLSMNKKKEMWEDAIEKLRSNQYREIGGKLTISYEALNVQEQEMFLDVACLLIGEDKQSVEYFWDGLVKAWRTGLESLVDRCLVKVCRKRRVIVEKQDCGEYECLTMHDHLRDLGRAIVENENKKTGKWSRLWDDTELFHVLRSKQLQGLDQIRGLATSLPILRLGLLSQMRSLRLLFLDGTELEGNDDDGLERLEIRWLKWTDRPEGSATQISVPKSLIVLELETTRRRHVRSHKTKVDETYLHFTSCVALYMTLYMHGLSDIKKLPPLSRLLQKKLPFSLGQLKKLRKLDISECHQLPEDLGSLETLEEFCLRSPILELPTSFGQLKKLRKLEIHGCHQLPEDFGSLESLEELDANNLAIMKLPSSFGQLRKLRKLDMGRCGLLEQLPEDFGSLENLEKLVVEGSGITNLPSSFGQLTKLRTLDMSCCDKLEQLPEDFGSLVSLEWLRVRESATTKLLPLGQFVGWVRTNDCSLDWWPGDASFSLQL